MKESIIQKIEKETGCDQSQIAKIATLVLRELHLISATNEYVTTGAIMECYWNFGMEASYHLGGILMYHDDKTNQSGFDSESGIPETMQRFLGYNEELQEINDRWLKYLERHRQYESQPGLSEEADD
jgi:hypothetical protein